MGPLNAITQLPDSASCLDQQLATDPYNNLGTNFHYSALLLGAQGFGGDGTTGLTRCCNNIDLPMEIPTQNHPLPYFDQFAAWN